MSWEWGRKFGHSSRKIEGNNGMGIGPFRRSHRTEMVGCMVWGGPFCPLHSHCRERGRKAVGQQGSTLMMGNILMYDSVKNVNDICMTGPLCTGSGQQLTCPLLNTSSPLLK
ncbi:hypothetical protein SUGI_0991700 [Cryptomeria japonica]|nr:hypothetical protein SUGI_0991700 [Cryptomeria japonica]